MAARIRVGIISFAHGHAYSYTTALKSLSNVEVVGLADDDVERGHKMAARFNMAYYDSREALLAQGLDAVVITSENARHHDDVLLASGKGVHILCEKPLSISSEACREMIEACDQNRVILQTAFPVRFNTSIQRVKSMIDNGELGTIQAIRGTNRGTNPGGWFVEKEMSGGGAVTDHTVHLVDIIRWFTGAEVSEVYAESDRYFSEIDVEDAGLVTLELNNGVFATIDCSWSRNREYPTWGDVGLEIVGSKGTVTVNILDQKLNVYSNRSGTEWDFWGDNMDQGLIEDFIESVQLNRNPSISGVDGMRAVQVVEAAYRSIAAHQPSAIK